MHELDGLESDLAIEIKKPHIRNNNTKTSQRLHKDFTKTSQRLHNLFTKTSQSVHKDFTTYPVLIVVLGLELKQSEMLLK